MRLLYAIACILAILAGCGDPFTTTGSGGAGGSGGSTATAGSGGSCIPEDTKECGSEIGECEEGIQMCQSDGTWGPCEGGVEAVDELCDGLDNDCDGDTDEDFDVGDDCEVGVGACQALGTKACTEDFTTTECDATEGTPNTEVCDGIDNNCDGTEDEGNTCLVTLGPDNSGCYEALLIEPPFMEKFDDSSTLDGNCYNGTVTGIPEPGWKYVLWEDDTDIQFNSPMAVTKVEAKCSQFSSPATVANMANEFSTGGLSMITFTTNGDIYTLSATDLESLTGPNCGNGTYYIEITF